MVRVVRIISQRLASLSEVDRCDGDSCPILPRWKIMPNGIIESSMKPRQMTKLSVPPKPETIAAGLRCSRSRNTAPSPVDTPQTASAILVMIAIAAMRMAGEVASILLDSQMSDILMVVIEKIAKINFAPIILALVTGESPSSQKP